MNNTNAQSWLDHKYPQNGICQRNSDLENKGKTRQGITLLDIRKGKVGNGLFSKYKNLIEELNLAGFTNLRKLIISSHQLIMLDVSDCPNLEELDCRGNELMVLKVSGCSNLKKIDCSNNPLRSLDLSTCPKLEEVNINGCPAELTEAETIKSHLTYDRETGKLAKGVVKNSPQIRKAQAEDIRNILIIGITGNGKSALANALSATDNFGESSASTSVTKHFQNSDIFEWAGKKYRVIDNIGFNDTANVANEDVLFEIGKGIRAAQEGINQVLFVFKDRFSEDQIIAFNLFKDFIDETGITKFTTIVKTGFEDFQDAQLCAEDQQGLLAQTKVLNEIINSCNNIIYVNNPPIPVIKENDSERIKIRKRQRAVISKEKREASRERILDHLSENCLEIYKLKAWDSIVAKVNDYKQKKAEIEQSNISAPEKDKELQKIKNEVAKEINEGIKVSLGVEVPGLPVGLNAAVEYTKHIVNW